MRSRWSYAVKSVANFPTTLCVGDSGVTSSGCALSSSTSSRHRASNCPSEMAGASST
jgi:hypothetical protein